MTQIVQYMSICLIQLGRKIFSLSVRSPFQLGFYDAYYYYFFFLYYSAGSCCRFPWFSVEHVCLTHGSLPFTCGIRCDLNPHLQMGCMSDYFLLSHELGCDLSSSVWRIYCSCHSSLHRVRCDHKLSLHGRLYYGASEYIFIMVSGIMSAGFITNFQILFQSHPSSA